MTTVLSSPLDSVGVGDERKQSSCNHFKCTVLQPFGPELLHLNLLFCLLIVKSVSIVTQLLLLYINKSSWCCTLLWRTMFATSSRRHTLVGRTKFTTSSWNQTLVLFVDLSLWRHHDVTLLFIEQVRNVIMTSHSCL